MSLKSHCISHIHIPLWSAIVLSNNRSTRNAKPILIISVRNICCKAMTKSLTLVYKALVLTPVEPNDFLHESRKDLMSLTSATEAS